MQAPILGCINYTSTREHVHTFVGTQLIVSTDDGTVITWNGNQLRNKSEDFYRKTHMEKRTPTRAELLLDAEWLENRSLPGRGSLSDASTDSRKRTSMDDRDGNGGDDNEEDHNASISPPVFMTEEAIEIEISQQQQMLLDNAEINNENPETASHVQKDVKFSVRTIASPFGTSLARAGIVFLFYILQETYT